MIRTVALVSIVVGALAVGLLTPPRAAAQCAMCRQALESSERTKVLAVQLNRGILFLLAAPVGVVGAIGVAMRRSRRSVR